MQRHLQYELEARNIYACELNSRFYETNVCMMTHPRTRELINGGPTKWRPRYHVTRTRCENKWKESGDVFAYARRVMQPRRSALTRQHDTATSGNLPLYTAGSRASGRHSQHKYNENSNNSHVYIAAYVRAPRHTQTDFQLRCACDNSRFC